MPRIGAGLDALEWDQSRAIILEIFQDQPIHITVYIPVHRNQNPPRRTVRKSPMLDNKTLPYEQREQGEYLPGPQRATHLKSKPTPSEQPTKQCYSQAPVQSGRPANEEIQETGDAEDVSPPNDRVVEQFATTVVGPPIGQARCPAPMQVTMRTPAALAHPLSVRSV